MESVRDLLAAHDDAPYPAELSDGDEAGGIALVLLDADIAGLAATYMRHGGVLAAEQWRALIECAAVARVLVPGLTGDAWVYFARPTRSRRRCCAPRRTFPRFEKARATNGRA